MGRRGWSAWLLGVASLVLTGWLQAHLAIAAIHDDGTTLRNALAVVDDSAMRSAFGGVLSSAVAGAGDAPEVQTAIGAIETAPALSGPVADALAATVLDARDQVFAQFERPAGTPATAISVPLGPLLGALGIPVTPETLAAAGLAADADPAALSYPLIDAATVDVLQQRYGWLAFLDAWGLLIAGVAAAAGVAISAKPLRTAAIALVLAGIVCLMAPILFGLLHDWIAGGGIGAWSLLAGPLLDSAVGELTPWLLPIGIVAAVLGAGLLALLIVLSIRDRSGELDVPDELTI
ncbi:hypothetical protein [Agromyces seonyuensis]|uniref:Uncharacterized protein n=1 Tax=Agromyces seonyuensis TaxID=2662446 RepID=A0A6I4P0R5_9MICO|nr:hypothetical protein [Agromyces seonyuensis]MWC00137.1 hypothetical protein [Agromyces seonyuensis]